MLAATVVAHAQPFTYPRAANSDPYFPGPGRYPLPNGQANDPRQPPRTQPSSAPSRQPYAPPRQNYPPVDDRYQRQPGGEGPVRPTRYDSAGANNGNSREPNLHEPAQIIARVGDQPIIMGELLGQVNQVLEPYVGKYPQSEIDKQRKLLVKQLVQVAIERKLMYLDFLREVPDPSKIPEIEKNVSEHFNKTQLEELMQKAKVNTPGELDLYLRRYGSSLEKMKKAFFEQAVSSQIMNKKVDRDPEITHEELLAEYNRNKKKYEVKAQVRWEQLTARFDKFPDRASAWRALAAMGNQVLRGAKFHAVARQSSQGSRAREGGSHDWTNQGSLASDVLDWHLFQLPIARLSQPIEDKDGFHIIRVIERREASFVPFVKAQVEIKENLRKEKIKKQREEYLAKVRKRTPVWTIFDDENSRRAADTDRRIDR